MLWRLDFLKIAFRAFKAVSYQFRDVAQFLEFQHCHAQRATKLVCGLSFFLCYHHQQALWGVEGGVNPSRMAEVNMFQFFAFWVRDQNRACLDWISVRIPFQGLHTVGLINICWSKCSISKENLARLANSHQCWAPWEHFFSHSI